MMPDYLDAPCGPLCRAPACEHAVKEGPRGRWYITIGHAGFNTRANNADGYATRAAALKAHRRHNRAAFG